MVSLLLLFLPGRGTEASIPARPSTKESTIPPFGFWPNWFWPNWLWPNWFEEENWFWPNCVCPNWFWDTNCPCCWNWFWGRKLVWNWFWLLGNCWMNCCPLFRNCCPDWKTCCPDWNRFLLVLLIYEILKTENLEKILAARTKLSCCGLDERAALAKLGLGEKAT